MNDVIFEQNTGINLYVTSDGYQECIVFYQTEFCAAHYKKIMENMLSNLDRVILYTLLSITRLLFYKNILFSTL